MSMLFWYGRLAPWQWECELLKLVLPRIILCGVTNCFQGKYSGIMVTVILSSRNIAQWNFINDFSCDVGNRNNVDVSNIKEGCRQK